jgi:periplasmic protein TonB
MRQVVVAIGLLVAMGGFVFAQNVKRITRAEALSAATSRVPPVYPPAARQLHIEGTVELEAEITATGTVEKVNIVNGNPILTRAAADAVKRWKFQPIVSDGKPVRAVAPLSFSFKQ